MFALVQVVTRKKDDPTARKADVTEDSVSEASSADSPSMVSRRGYMKAAAATIPLLGGVGAQSATAATNYGPPNPDNWTLSFEDKFEQSALDSSKWDLGFGWGMETSTSAESISADEVTVSDGTLRLSASHQDGVTAGSVHTKNLHTFGPGSYWEARLKPPKREGFLPAFWAKPNSEAWPPELDFFELFQTGDGSEDWTSANYNIHYSSSTEPGDSSTHESDPYHHKVETDLTKDFHVYGCKWLSDRVEWYFDGQKVGETQNETAMEALRRGAPFYMMLNIHIDKIGTTDRSEPWTEELVYDWVRVWEQGDGGTSSSGNESSADDSSATEHYFWARSANGDSVSFEFQASNGNVRLDSSGYEADVWVSADRTTAGGTVTHTGAQLPGFWYEGEISNFSYEGPIEVYIDDQPVDPSQLGSNDSGSTDGNTSDNTQTSDGSTDGSSSDGSSDSTTNEKLLIIDGTGNANLTSRYQFSVSGSVTRDRERSTLSDGGLPWDTLTDEVTDGHVTGIVGNGIDAYRYTGTLTNIDTRGQATFNVELV